MTKSEFAQLLKDPAKLPSGEEELKEICERYPWFAVANTLLSKAYFVKQASAYDRQLEKTALLSGNRTVLFNFINDLPVDATAGKEVELRKVDITARVNKISRPDFDEEKAAVPSMDEQTEEQEIPVQEIPVQEEPLNEELIHEESQHEEPVPDEPAPAVEIEEEEIEEEPHIPLTPEPEPEEEQPAAEKEDAGVLGDEAKEEQAPEEESREELPIQEPEPVFESKPVAPEPVYEKAVEVEAPKPEAKPVEEKKKEEPVQLVESKGKLVRFESPRNVNATDEISQITDLSLDDKILPHFDESSFSEETVITRVPTAESEEQPETPVWQETKKEEVVEHESAFAGKQEAENIKQPAEESPVEEISEDGSTDEIIPFEIGTHHEVAASESPSPTLENLPEPEEPAVEEEETEVPATMEEPEPAIAAADEINEEKADEGTADFIQWLNQNKKAEEKTEEKVPEPVAEKAGIESEKPEEDEAFLTQIRSILKQRAEKQKTSELGEIVGKQEEKPAEPEKVEPVHKEEPAGEEPVYDEISSFEIEPAPPADANAGDMFRTAEVESILPEFPEVEISAEAEEKIISTYTRPEPESEAKEEVNVNGREQESLPVEEYHGSEEFTFPDFGIKKEDRREEAAAGEEVDSWKHESMHSLEVEVDPAVYARLPEPDQHIFEDSFSAVFPGGPQDQTGGEEEESHQPVKTPDPEVDHIIERFITENPSISRPRAEFFNPLNTARLSVEEDESLATETLARIYISQGLSRKAIAVYEKLALISPEKSAYFAGLIKQLKNNPDQD